MPYRGSCDARPSQRAVKPAALKVMTDAVLHSVITCPHCGFAQREAMPTDACRFFYDCRQCGARLRPKHGDCCVFCSFGSVPCPPKQLLAGHAARSAKSDNRTNSRTRK
jgi:hypothetical protein